LPGRLQPGSETDMNIIVLFDYPYSPTTPNGDAKMYEITSSGVNKIADMGAKNMGSWTTLRNFIQYCKTNYPAYHYSLNLVDHGRGYAGFCYDYHATHPYWEYALGDCLEVNEVELALSIEGGVDVLFLDTCSGGSFEVAWQMYGEADYMVAGETTQGYVALCHFVDIYSQLSYDTSSTPIELAQIGFNSAKVINYYSPVLDPGSNMVDSWGSVTLYSLNRFESFTGGPSFKPLFNELTTELIYEIMANKTTAFELFSNIRGNLTTSGLSSHALMVDLYNFLEVILDYTGQFNNTNIVTKADQVKSLLEPGPGQIIHDNWVYSETYLPNIHGFSICFPDSLDLYQGYLYPNFYEELDISTETFWDDFIFSLFPHNYTNFLKPPYFEWYEFYLNLIDPVVALHVNLYLWDEMYHVGLRDTLDFGMGIEIEVDGAQFMDDLLFGNSYIRIPVTSFQVTPKKGLEDGVTMQVIVNATGSPTATQLVNLTVKHVKGNEVLWQANQVTDFEVGQIIECNVTTDDEITDFVKTDVTPTKRFGLEPVVTIITISTSLVLLLVFDRRRRKYK
ncbi:MAG: clostripain-related cysteine peptidase, partial [Candidatus Heimdallarchaeota archaeon]